MRLPLMSLENMAFTSQYVANPRASAAGKSEEFASVRLKTRNSTTAKVPTATHPPSAATSSNRLWGYMESDPEASWISGR